jgi:hypothetical protein
MKKFVENLKQNAQENPMLTLAAAAAVITATAKLIDAVGHAQGSRAYAKDVNRRVKNHR